MSCQFPIAEVFGFPHDNGSAEAARCREEHVCPFINQRCTKQGHGLRIPLGVCSVGTPDGPIITHPERFYENRFAVLDEVIEYMFGTTQSVEKIPEVRAFQAGSIDWILAKHKEGTLLDYVGAEVQSIDITGTVRPAFENFIFQRQVDQAAKFGINYRNVVKRMLPQLLNKGMLFDGWGKKMAVVLQDILFNDIVGRMPLTEQADKQRANMVFFVYKMGLDVATNRWRLRREKTFATTYTNLLAAFTGGTIPPREAFDQRIERRLATLLKSRGQS